MKIMGKIKRVVKIAAIALVIILVAGILFASQGLSEMQELVIYDVDLGKLPDGVYTGKFDRYRWAHTVEITVKDHRIASIQATNRQQIHDELINRIITQQTPKVDVVSGATVSSKAFLKAVEKALSPE